jgi:hypothetical protein
LRGEKEEVILESRVYILVAMGALDGGEQRLLFELT